MGKNEAFHVLEICLLNTELDKLSNSLNKYCLSAYYMTGIILVLMTEQ